MIETERRDGITTGQRLKKWRGHWSEIVAAAELNVPHKVYREFETGHRPIPEKVLDDLAKRGF